MYCLIFLFCCETLVLPDSDLLLLYLGEDYMFVQRILIWMLCADVDSCLDVSGISCLSFTTEQIVDTVEQEQPVALCFCFVIFITVPRLK